MKNKSRRRFQQVPLEKIAAVAEAAAPKVLSVSRDGVLAQTRSTILQRAGLQVDTVMDTEEAARLLFDKSYDAVVLEHSLSREGKAEVIGAARSARSAPWIIGLYNLWSSEARGVHIAIDTQDGAEALVTAIRRLVSGRSGETSSSRSSQHR